jgi:hypothetical protein
MRPCFDLICFCFVCISLETEVEDFHSHRHPFFVSTLGQLAIVVGSVVALFALWNTLSWVAVIVSLLAAASIGVLLWVTAIQTLNSPADLQALTAHARAHEVILVLHSVNICDRSINSLEIIRLK